MYSFKLFLFVILVNLFLLTSCATIIGGSKYKANIEVIGRPNAKIIYNNQVQGTGTASIKIYRRNADKFTFTVREEGCTDQTFNFTSRKFRGWAFAGSIIGWTSITRTGTPLPWGAILDLATGAIWKPDVKEYGVSKQNYKNFKYTVNYNVCTPNNLGNPNVLDVIYLKNGSILKGTIIEQRPNEYITFQTKLGNVFNIKMDEIDKITRE